jgi:hypothetical protein
VGQIALSPQTLLITERLHMKKDTKWKRGESGNPRGRKVGSKDRRSALRDVLGAELPAIVARLVDAAKVGDVQAASLLLSRCLPSLRPSRELVEVPGLKADRTPTEVATALISAATRGELPSDAAAELVAALGSVARLREVDELAARIAALEKGNQP